MLLSDLSLEQNMNPWRKTKDDYVDACDVGKPQMYMGMCTTHVIRKWESLTPPFDTTAMQRRKPESEDVCCGALVILLHMVLTFVDADEIISGDPWGTGWPSIA